MHVIVFTVHLDKSCFKILTYLAKDFLERDQVPPGKDFSPVFRHKDQIGMKAKNAMSTSSNFT